jgi:hypothetical protein
MIDDVLGPVSCLLLSKLEHFSDFRKEWTASLPPPCMMLDFGFSNMHPPFLPVDITPF